jgi:hypothetical protein
MVDSYPPYFFKDPPHRCEKMRSHALFTTLKNQITDYNVVLKKCWLNNLPTP